MRKYYNQMNRGEVHALVNRIKRLNDCQTSLTRHAIERMKERNVSEYEINNVFNNFNIVKFDLNPKGRIVALISDNNPRLRVSLSIDLTNGEILTVYKKGMLGVNKFDTRDNGSKLDIKSLLNYYRIDRRIRKLKGR